MTRSGRSSRASCDGLLAVAGLAGHDVALLGQHLGQVEADQRLVLDHEHPQAGGRRRPGWLVLSAGTCWVTGTPLRWTEPFRMDSEYRVGARVARCDVAPRAPAIVGDLAAPVAQRQRQRFQKPSSVGSNPTGGTTRRRCMSAGRGRSGRADVDIARSAVLIHPGGDSASPTVKSGADNAPHHRSSERSDLIVTDASSTPWPAPGSTPPSRTRRGSGTTGSAARTTSRSTGPPATRGSRDRPRASSTWPAPRGRSSAGRVALPGRRGGHPAVPRRRHRPADRRQHPRGRPAGRPGRPGRLRRPRPAGAGPRPRPADRHPGGRDPLHRRRHARPGADAGRRPRRSWTSTGRSR